MRQIPNKNRQSLGTTLAIFTGRRKLYLTRHKVCLPRLRDLPVDRTRWGGETTPRCVYCTDRPPQRFASSEFIKRRDTRAAPATSSVARLYISETGRVRDRLRIARLNIKSFTSFSRTVRVRVFVMKMEVAGAGPKITRNLNKRNNGRLINAP